MKKEIETSELYKDLWDAIDIMPYCESKDCHIPNARSHCHIHKPKAWQAVMKVLEKHGIQK